MHARSISPLQSLTRSLSSLASQGSAEYVIDGHGLAATSFNVQNESIGMADSVADWKIPST